MSGRGKSQNSKDLIDAMRRILEDIQPATVRGVCYRLFVAGLIPSMAKSETQKVSRLLVYAREQCFIAWESVVDETREAERVNTWINLRDYGQAVLRSYRKNFWSQQSELVEVWSEKGTVRGTIAPVLEEFAVTFRVMHGFGSATSVMGVSAETFNLDRPLRVLYIGDYDPSGLFMSEADLPRRLARYGANISLHRVALTAVDVACGLPSFEASTKRGDPRHGWFVKNYGPTCWELDAMSPPVLRERVRAAILTHIDAAAWNRCAKVQEVERKSIEGFCWGDVFSDQYQNNGDRS